MSNEEAVDRTQIREWYRLAREVEANTPIFLCNTKHGEVKYFCYGGIACWRADTLLTKEPETIEWIDGMLSGEVFWDIGANVGLYSVYAAKKGLTVFSFEPSAYNFFMLTKNIEINDMQNDALCYPVAISDKSEFGVLNMTMTSAGGAMSTFSNISEKLDEIKCGGVASDVVFRQGMLSFGIDELISIHGFTIPNHIKIDVDGIEDMIIKGGLKTLADKRVKSILIELDENEVEYSDKVIGMLQKCGFYKFTKAHSQMIEDGAYKSIYNFIFEKSNTL